MKVTTPNTVREEMLWYLQKRIASTRYIAKNAVLRVVKSDIQAQKMRPTPFPTLITPTRPAAAAALALPISWKMGAACETIDNPAMVFTDINMQIAHHCHVLNASPRVKSRSHRCEICFADGVQPCGAQPSGGFCMNEPAATAMIPYAIPRYANVGINPTCRISHPPARAKHTNPAPNPPTAIPVMNPRRAGNNFASTLIRTSETKPS